MDTMEQGLKSAAFIITMITDNLRKETKMKKLILISIVTISLISLAGIVSADVFVRFMIESMIKEQFNVGS